MLPQENPTAATVDESTTTPRPAPQTVRQAPEHGIPAVIMHPEDSALPACPLEDRRRAPRE